MFLFMYLAHMPSFTKQIRRFTNLPLVYIYGTLLSMAKQMTGYLNWLEPN